MEKDRENHLDNREDVAYDNKSYRKKVARKRSTHKRRRQRKHLVGWKGVGRQCAEGSF